MCVYGIKQHQHASVFVCMFTWEKCLIHTSHSNYFNLRKKTPNKQVGDAFIFEGRTGNVSVLGSA